MKRLFFLAFGAAIALQPATVDAQVLSGPIFETEYLDFIGGSGVNGGWGVQVGPYRGSFLADSEVAPSVDRTTTSNEFALYCVDYLHYASTSEGLVTTTDLTGAPDLAGTNTRLQDYSRYRTSAYLASLFDSWETHQATLDADFAGSFTKSNVWGGLHAAIWNVATGPEDLGSGQAAVARGYFLGLATSNAGTFNTDGWYVVSDLDQALSNQYSGQEFLIRTIDVPEPTPLLLLLSGVFILFGANRRRFGVEV